MSTGGGSFDDWCREAVDRFLQSVLVVDDHATLEADDAVGAVVDPSEFAPIEDHDDSEAPTERPEQPLDAKTLTDEFAKAGLVCGLMKPDRDEPSAKTVVAVARRADIVLLDWRLDDRGERATEIVRQLAECDGLRLIAIYTSAGELDDIAKTVADRLNGIDESGTRQYKHEDESFRVTGDGLTIEVYAKEGSQGSGAEGERLIAPQDIPNRLIDDFVRMTRGIVPTAAIATIGALRIETPKILGLLGTDLDFGYLGHRVLLPDPDESGDHLIDLIGSELRTVIEDNEVVRKAVGYEVIERFVEQMAPGYLPADALKMALKIGVTKEEARQEIEKMPGVNGANPPLAGGKKSRTACFMNGDADAAREADRRFAIKLSIRTPSGVPPRLGLGTIVKNEDGDYLICLQPECDSVRLDEPRLFPFLPLRHAEEYRGQDLLVGDATSAVGFAIKGSPYELRMLSFSPDSIKRSVTARRTDNRGFVFAADDGGNWNFVAQLRNAHSQDLAYQLASKIGRVGVDQSEVQRLWQKRGG